METNKNLKISDFDLLEKFLRNGTEGLKLDEIYDKIALERLVSLNLIKQDIVTGNFYAFFW